MRPAPYLASRGRSLAALRPGGHSRGQGARPPQISHPRQSRQWACKRGEEGRTKEKNQCGIEAQIESKNKSKRNRQKCSAATLCHAPWAVACSPRFAWLQDRAPSAMPRPCYSAWYSTREVDSARRRSRGRPARLVVRGSVGGEARRRRTAPHRAGGREEPRELNIQQIPASSSTVTPSFTSSSFYWLRRDRERRGREGSKAERGGVAERNRERRDRGGKR